MNYRKSELHLDNSETKDQHQIVKDSVQFLSANIVARGIEMVRSVLITIIFSPAQLGIWNLMGVVRGYGANAQLGILDGMNKAIPYLLGEDKLEEIEEIKDAVFWMNLMLGLIGGAVVWIASYQVPKEYALSLRVIAFAVFLQLIHHYLYALLRAFKRFELLSIGMVIFSVLTTVLVVVFALAFSDPLIGALIGFTLAYVVVNTYWQIKGGYRFPFRLSLKPLRKTLILGFPIIILGVLNMLFMSVDRWVIITNLDSTILGYYSLGFMGGNLLLLVSGSIASVLYPYMLERIGITKDPTSLQNMLRISLRILSAVMLLLVCSAVFGIPLLIRLFLPKYIPSIPIINVLFPAAFFLSISSIAGMYLIAINKQAWLIGVLVIGIFVCLIADLVFLWSGYGLIGVAYGTFIGYAYYGLGYIGIAVYYAFGRAAEVVRELSLLFMPFVVMVLTMTAVNLTISDGATPLSALGSTALKFGIVVAVFLPALWYVNRGSGLIAMARAELRNWREARGRSL